MNNTLESHKFFPYVAWGIILAFAIFTYMLNARVTAELSQLGDGVERLEQRINDLDTKAAQTEAVQPE